MLVLFTLIIIWNNINITVFVLYFFLVLFYLIFNVFFFRWRHQGDSEKRSKWWLHQRQLRRYANRRDRSRQPVYSHAGPLAVHLRRLLVHGARSGQHFDRDADDRRRTGPHQVPQVLAVRWGDAHLTRIHGQVYQRGDRRFWKFRFSGFSFNGRGKIHNFFF